mgnify:CR=1 FL=1
MERPYKMCLKVWAMLCLCLLAACSDDAGTAGPDGRGVVNIRLTRATEGPANEYEHVKTLRIIIADQSNSTIFYNNLYYDDIEESESTWTETFHDLPATAAGTPYNFYAIANESAFLASGESLEGTDAGILTLLNNYELTKDFDVTGDYIPQTAKVTQPVSSADDDENTVHLPLQYVVGKVRLTIVNDTNAPKMVSDLKIGGIVGDSAPLFAPESVTATGSDLSFGEVTVPAGEPVVKSAYVYETASDAGYTLTASYNGKEQTLKLNSLTSIPRGQCVNITVNLSVSALYATWKVTDWDDESFSYDLSDNGVFEITPVTARLFTGALATVYSQSAGASAQQLTFTVRMTAPEGVRWIAHLTNPADFEFADASQGIGGAEQPVTLTVRPTKTAATMETRRTTELYFTIDTDRDAEQSFDASSLGLGNTPVTRIPIVQVTAAEWNDIQQP